jgi:hypothetical protein
MAIAFKADTFDISTNTTLISGTADPSAGGGVAAPIGSLYTRTGVGTGQLWIKTAAGNTAWLRIADSVITGNPQRFTYTASGAEGNPFNVNLPAARANAGYVVFVNKGDMAADVGITIPNVGRTTLLFPVLLTGSLTLNDKLEFYVADPT